VFLNNLFIQRYKTNLYKVIKATDVPVKFRKKTKGTTLSVTEIQLPCEEQQSNSK